MQQTAQALLGGLTQRVVDSQGALEAAVKKAAEDAYLEMMLTKCNATPEQRAAVRSADAARRLKYAMEDALGLKPPTHDANGNIIMKSRDQVAAESALQDLKQEVKASEQMLNMSALWTGIRG